MEGAEAASALQAEARARYERDELLAISRALSAERDIRKLLDLILRKSREITGADAGSVYIVEGPDDSTGAGATSTAGSASPAGASALGAGRRGQAVLHFMLSQNDSVAVDFQESRLAIDASSIAGEAAFSRQPSNIPDFSALAGAGAGLTHDGSFDRKTGYQTRSMLTVPMLSAMGDVIGVIQLINKKRDPARPLRAPADFAAEVVPFDARAEEMALALASQAGVSLENAILNDEIRRLFESFVAASVTAIEARDPTTSGHSRRVATLAVALARRVDATAEGPLAHVRFSADELRQLEYAGVLHDFGKVGVREQVLVKAKKLYDWQLAAVAQRFRYIRRLLEADVLRGKVELFRTSADVPPDELVAFDQVLAERLARIDDFWRVVVAANEPIPLDGPTRAGLDELATMTYPDEQGRPQPYLLPEERAALAVARGSLTPEERAQIENHVGHTLAFLRTIPWGRALRDLPSIAGAHHELLDGSGYPAHLRGDQIGIEARILTLADIFDALTAADRPYKAAVPLERALAILDGEARAGRCDRDLLHVFVEGELWREVL